MSKRTLVLMCSIFLIVPLLFMGCSGDDGSTGAAGPPGTPGDNATATAKPETCAVCHPGGGDKHQEFYDTLYQGGVIKVTDLGVVYAAPDEYTTTFTMTKKDSAGGFSPINCESVTNLNAYIVSYTDNIFQMPDATIPPDGGADRLTLKPGPPSATNIADNTYTYRGSTTIVGNSTTGLCTITGTYTDNVADFTGTPGFLVVYGYDGLVAQLPPSRVRQVNYPYAGLLKLGTVDYVSAANVSGCEKCHTVPYLKHGNILGQVDNVATDLITCKACHLDNGDGGHQVWQLLVDDTVKAGDYWALNPGGVEEEMTLAELAKYAYKTRLMNDVHMSHAMEFEYPQSMANCNTCHAGKLNAIFADANFNFETCKSCHAVTGSPQAEKPQPALKDMMNSFHFTAGTDNVNATHVDCFDCHSFTDFHTGYDKVIYATDNGVKYSDVIKVTIDNASFDNNSMLTIEFSAAGTAGGLDSADIAPTVLVGLYGYDTKDYIAGPHERTFDDNGDGVANSSDSRNLEYAVGATHPRFTTDNTTPAGSWKVTANLSHWAGMISAGSVKRVEIGVMPALKNPGNDNALVALDAPSRTFNLGSKTFTDSFYPAIVKVATGCNNCHDALATTFHSADRGGNIVVCRLCHITKNGGSHLEMQSRSIDSYAHAIHTFQDFDTGDIDFDNNVQSMFHDLKIESHYPTFDTTNCTSCHNAGTFNVPDQAKSLAGILSASDDVAGRTLNDVPAYVSGPASRACGACHRAELIKEDAAAEFASFNQHTKDGGYLLVPGDIPTLTAAINAIMPMFYDDVMVVLP